MLACSSLSLVTAIAALGCQGDPDPPPIPTSIRTASIIGQVVDYAPDGGGYVLDDGRVVELGLQASSEERPTLMSRTNVAMPSGGAPGGLLMFGNDQAGAFYAATLPPDAVGCFALGAEGYIEDGQMHLSSGLVLPFAPGMTRINDRDARYVDPTWLLDFDAICLDAEGSVTSIHQLPLGV
jgi:hypothetical protein